MAFLSFFTPVIQFITGLNFLRIWAFLTGPVGRWVSGAVIVLMIAITLYHKGGGAERAKWRQAVEKKQRVIDDRVRTVETITDAESRANRRGERNRRAVRDLVVDGIKRTEPPDPVESTTVDLLNQVE